MTAVWDLKAQLQKFQGQEVFDCLVAEFLLSDGRSVPAEEAVLKKYKVATLTELAEKQQEKLTELPKLNALFHDVDMPLVGVLWQMERAGIALDKKRLAAVGEELDKAIKRTEEEIHKEVGVEINLNSSVQVGNYLAEKAGVPLKKTKTGRYATNENELVQFAETFPIIKKLLTYRELSKLRSTYVESLIDKVDEKGRVHTTYHQAAVSTGRLASSNPNLQNIPVTSEFGLKIKSCFTATEGHTLLSFDLSQQELRILAHLTGEEKLIDAFTHGRDVHKTTASQLFSVSYDDVTKQQRMIAKTTNFGIIYGMSSFGLSSSLQIPVEEAQMFIDTFYATYPAIREYYERYLKEGKTRGFVETLLGRRRYVFEYPGQKFIDNGMRRVLMNYPIQGTAADLMRMSMVRLQNELLNKDPSIHMLLQIHDDLVFEVPDNPEKIAEIVRRVTDIMCNTYPLSVPVEVGVKQGRRWGEMKAIS